MYYVLALFNLFVAVSAVAVVLGEPVSPTPVIYAAAVIAVAALAGPIVSVWLAVSHRQAKKADR